MKTFCKAAGQFQGAEDPSNLPQRHLMVLMISSWILKKSPSSFPSSPSSVFLHKSLIHLTSTICPGRLLENSGIYFRLFNNSIYTKKKKKNNHGALSSGRSTIQHYKRQSGFRERLPIQTSCLLDTLNISPFSLLQKVESISLCTCNSQRFSNAKSRVWCWVSGVAPFSLAPLS